jgi:murein tripeptide amidase MpaA
MRRFISPLLLASLVGAAHGQGVRYDGHRVVRASIRDFKDLRTVLALTDDVWSHRVGVGGPVDLRVTPEQFAAVHASGVPYTVVVHDVQAAVEAERAAMAQERGPGWFDTYRDYGEVRSFARSITLANPAFASFEIVGQSIEGRDIFALRLSAPGGVNRPQVLLIGGQHAREWVSISTVMYLANELVAAYGSDPRTSAAMDNLEFIIVPIANPDGYVHTWPNGGNERLWRKNRRDTGAGTGICIGVDMNRNWGFQWGGQGASAAPCSETYRGDSPFSEPETLAIRDLSNLSPRLVAAIDYHSYSQLVMSPWGYTATLPPPPDAGFFNQLTSSIRDGIRGSGGAIYTSGPIYSTIYPASGTAVDWWYGGRNIYGLTIELRDTGSTGFLLPPSQIIPTAQENFAGLMSMVEYFLPVRIWLPSSPPAPLTPHMPTSIDVGITSGPGWSLEPGSPAVLWRIGTSGPFTSSPLATIGPDLYRADLPPVPCGTTVEYFFQAAAAGGPTLSYPAGPGMLRSTAYVPQLVFDDDMEQDRGWTVINHPSLTGGAWERGDPVGTFNLNGDMANPEDDATPDPGVMCYVTQNGAPGAAAGLTDVDGGPTRLVSPPINLAGAASALVQYNRWVYSANGSPDPLIVEISHDGQSFMQVELVTTTNGWKAASFVVPEGFPMTSAFHLRFSIADEPNNSLTEAAIDDVRVFALACPACYANCDGSTGTPLLTSNDFQCFLNRFAAGDAFANCDGSTGTPLLTSNDFQCFLNKFAAGCP